VQVRKLQVEKAKCEMNEESVNDVEQEQPPTPEELARLLETEKNRSEEYRTRLGYMQADFENLRRRCDRQILDVTAYGTERLVIQLLEVVDELELAVKNAENNSSAETLIEGVKMTLKRLRKVLEQEGVTPIESIGKPFDPSKHNAISAEEREDAEGCMVLEEVRKGYMMKEKVVRPSLVKVLVKKSKSQNKEEKSNESS
jgi:molecular chaperone GrpE